MLQKKKKIKKKTTKIQLNNLASGLLSGSPLVFILLQNSKPRRGTLGGVDVEIVWI